MKRLFTILSALSLIVTGCQKDPNAHASITPNPAYVSEDINFTNLSTNTDYVEWDMGDGTASSAFNVTHYYVDPGTYNAKLTAFRDKGGVSVASFMVDVIGAELKVIVRLWTPANEPDGYLLPDASVILYPTLLDWEEQTNPVLQYVNGQEVIDLITNNVGECIFEGLSYQRYYVDVWEQNHDNYILASESVDWIETDPLEGAYYQTFVAYVDYYADGKKSATISRPAERELVISEESTGSKRELKINKISKPRK